MKEKQRKSFLEKRDALSLEEIMEKSEKIKAKFFSLKEVWKAKKIMAYVSFKSEVRTREIILELLKRKKRVIVPLIDFKKKEIYLSELKDFQKELIPNKLGIFQPARKFFRPFKAKELDLVVVPGIAFDEKGNRIGFGKGYYDKFLSKLPKRVKVIGLAFEEQIGKKILTEKHDVRMHKIITEKRVIECNN
jgi:5-formyltetrahydrofolate cyclo-ligase